MTTPSSDEVDIRGPRFSASLTTFVLALVVVLAGFSPLSALLLLGVQTLIFAVTALVGPRKGPYGQLYVKVVLPRLSPPSLKEPVAPLRFAQLVGFVFGFIGVTAFALGITTDSVTALTVGIVATAFALIAAFLNAVFGLCLGCQIYPLVRRAFPSSVESTNLR